jgi:hypothetical protein
MRLNELNRAPASVPFSFGIFAERNGSDAGPAIASLAIEVAFDDGGSWQPFTLDNSTDRWIAMVNHPARGYVSLRAKASDTDVTPSNKPPSGPAPSNRSTRFQCYGRVPSGHGTGEARA